MYFGDNFKELLFFIQCHQSLQSLKAGKGGLEKREFLDDLGRTLVADNFVIKTIVYCRLLKFFILQLQLCQHVPPVCSTMQKSFLLLIIL